MKQQSNIFKKPDLPVARSLKAHSPVKKFVAILICGILGITLICVGVCVTGMYVSHWEAPIVKNLAKVLPIPAMSVDGHWRSYNEYYEAVATLDYSFDQDAVLQASGYSEKPSAQELRTIVLDRMVKEEMIDQVAERRGVTVLDADVDAEMQKLIEQTGTQAEVEAQIQQLYQWNLDEFRDKVLEPYMLRQRLQENIANDDSVNTEQAATAQALLARVQSGEDFETIAKEVNEDSTQSSGGDMGVWGRGEKDAAIENAAFSLEVGGTSDVIKTTEGYYIIKLLEKIPADEAAGTEETVHTEEIFIAVKALDTWLYEQSKDFKVSIFLSGYSWNSEDARVVYTTSTDASDANTNGNANSSAE